MPDIQLPSGSMYEMLRSQMRHCTDEDLEMLPEVLDRALHDEVGYRSMLSRKMEAAYLSAEAIVQQWEGNPA